MRQPSTKATMPRIAATYDVMAERAAKREASKSVLSCNAHPGKPLNRHVQSLVAYFKEQSIASAFGGRRDAD